MTKEVWKLCLGGWYEVSSHGNVRRARAGKRTRIGRLLKLLPRGEGGYKRVACCIDGKVFFVTVHVLVAHAFIGPCPLGKEVNHKDLNKGNNIWTNLEYVTPKENSQHASLHGRYFGSPGEDHPNTDLSCAEVQKMRVLYNSKKYYDLYASGRYDRRCRVLAKEFGTSYGIVYNIVTGRTWKRYGVEDCF